MNEEKVKMESVKGNSEPCELTDETLRSSVKIAGGASILGLGLSALLAFGGVGGHDPARKALNRIFAAVSFVSGVVLARVSLNDQAQLEEREASRAAGGQGPKTPQV